MNEPMKLEKNRILRNARDVYKYKNAESYLETIRKTADELESALAELAEIKKVVENWDEGEYYTDSIHSMKKIENILKGETK